MLQSSGKRLAYAGLTDKVQGPEEFRSKALTSGIIGAIQGQQQKQVREVYSCSRSN